MNNIEFVYCLFAWLLWIFDWVQSEVAPLKMCAVCFPPCFGRPKKPTANEAAISRWGNFADRDSHFTSSLSSSSCWTNRHRPAKNSSAGYFVIKPMTTNYIPFITHKLFIVYGFNSGLMLVYFIVSIHLSCESIAAADFQLFSLPFFGPWQNESPSVFLPLVRCSVLLHFSEFYRAWM